MSVLTDANRCGDVTNTTCPSPEPPRAATAAPDAAWGGCTPNDAMAGYASWVPPLSRIAIPVAVNVFTLS